MDNKYLLEQNKDPAKVTFEKEVKLIEFTETIDNMDSNLNYDQKKRDIFLFKHGKKLFKRFKLRKTKKRNIFFQLEPRILTQAEIDELLTAVEIYPFPKVIISMIILTFKGIITKIKYGYRHICEWKLVIRKNNVVYKIGLDEIEIFDYNILKNAGKRNKHSCNIPGMEVLSREELDMLLTPLEKKREVLSEEEMDMLFKKEKGCKKNG